MIRPGSIVCHTSQIFVVGGRVVYDASAAYAVLMGDDKYFWELGSVITHVFNSALSDKDMIVL